MDAVQLSARERAISSKLANRRLRRAKRVPAVIYGGEIQPIAIDLDDHELEMQLRGALESTALFEIRVQDGAKPEQTIIRDIQRHPVSQKLVHVDFLRIDLTKPLIMDVPIHAVGTPKGVRAGGIMEIITRSVQVRCLPINVPKNITIDVSEVEINQSLHLGDLKLPEGVELHDDADTALLAVLPPKMEAEPTPGEEAAEPEVIGAKKEEEAEEKEKK